MFAGAGLSERGGWRRRTTTPLASLFFDGGADGSRDKRLAGRRELLSCASLAARLGLFFARCLKAGFFEPFLALLLASFAACSSLRLLLALGLGCGCDGSLFLEPKTFSLCFLL